MDSPLWWYLARTGGLMAWWLLSASTLWGLALSTQILGARARSSRLLDLHRFLSMLALVFLALHLMALLADRWVNFGMVELLVPLTSTYRPVAVAWGITALYVLAAVVVTSVLKTRIRYRWWRYVHTSTFVVFALTVLHALTAGTDTTLVRGSALLVSAAVMFLIGYRLLVGRRPSTASAPPHPDTAAVVAADNGSLYRPAIVSAVEDFAECVAGITLVAADGGALPTWEPGAHIDLVLPTGQVRQYSLVGDPADTSCYRIAVCQGSADLNGAVEAYTLRAGQQVRISLPRNNFPLVLAGRYLFLAGGIGITALLSMIRAVAAAGLDWQLVFVGRTRTSMAFTGELAALGGDRVQIVPTDTAGRPDLAAALHAAPTGTAIYCCGPEPMTAAVEQAVAAEHLAVHLHVERFSPASRALLDDLEHPARPFEVKLQRSNRVLPVAADQTLLQVILQADPNTPWSCGQGYCGTCALKVLDGVPEHHDSILPASQRHRTDIIYPCVSRAQGPLLVVDR